MAPAGFRRQQHFSLSDENAASANPNFSKGIENCQRCVPTYEMRMRGYDVIAKWYRDRVFNGARAEIYVSWKDGELDVGYYFDLVKRGETKFFRMDNLEVNEQYIEECCEDAIK